MNLFLMETVFYLFTYLFIYLFIYLFVCLYIHSFLKNVTPSAIKKRHPPLYQRHRVQHRLKNKTFQSFQENGG